MDGYDYLTDLAKSGRLFIRDALEIQDIESMEMEIKRRMNRKLFVVIDALYNLDTGDQADRGKENIEIANRLKMIVNIYSIPVICTGELVKDPKRIGENKRPTVHDLKETGKFAYNADIVLMLYPKNWSEYNSQNEPTLIMKYEKNKLSPFKGIQALTFTRGTGQLKEN